MLFLCISVLMSNMENTSSYFPMDDTIEGVTGHLSDPNPKRSAKSTIKDDHRDDVSQRLGAKDFGRAVAKIAVAQICENVGFQGFRESALDALVEFAIQYLCDLGKTTSFYANLAGRTECNIFDIIKGLEDLGTTQRFPTASIVNQCLIGSATIREIVEYIDSAEEIPLSQPVPKFPVIRNQRLIPSFTQMGEMPPSKHIPAWLPAFPDLHTYIHTPMWNERSTDPRADKIEQARQQRKAERSLLSLQQRLVSAGSVEKSASMVPDDDAEEFRVIEDSPSPKAPLRSVDKDISAIHLPTKTSVAVEGENHVSVLEAFAPAIEAVKGGLSYDVDYETKILPEKRPAVYFKFKSGTKYVGKSLDLSLRKKSERAVSWITREEERDDKKRRAEYILRQSMENPQELMQL